MEQEEVPGSRQGRKPGCREGPVVLGLGGSWCREGRSWEVEGLGDRRLLRPCTRVGLSLTGATIGGENLPLVLGHEWSVRAFRVQKSVT